MPSSYVCIYTRKDNKTIVLVAKKKLKGMWLGWNGTDYRDPQKSTRAKRVSSKEPLEFKIFNNAGQHVFPGGKKEDADETQLACAFREFREETGYDLGHLEGKAVLKDLKDRDNAQFHGVYIKLNDAEFDTIFSTIEKKLELQKQTDFKPEDHPEKTTDDELELVEQRELNDAIAVFKAENLEVPKSTTWFTIMLQDLLKEG